MTEMEGTRNERPSLVDFRRVALILRRTPGLEGKLGEIEMVQRKDGELIPFSSEVIRVARALNKQGTLPRKATAIRIREIAVSLLAPELSEPPPMLPEGLPRLTFMPDKTRGTENRFVCFLAWWLWESHASWPKRVNRVYRWDEYQAQGSHVWVEHHHHLARTAWRAAGMVFVWAKAGWDTIERRVWDRKKPEPPTTGM